jgi:hypothetical protein
VCIFVANETMQENPRQRKEEDGRRGIRIKMETLSTSTKQTKERETNERTSLMPKLSS